MRVKYRNTPDCSIAVYAISYDRGRTWRTFDDPFRDYFKMNGIADTFVGHRKRWNSLHRVDELLPAERLAPHDATRHKRDPGLLYGNTDLAWSTDDGKTWSTPDM